MRYVLMVCLLLFFTLIGYAQQPAQQSPAKYGEVWLLMPVEYRMMYVRGYTHGVKTTHAFIAAKLDGSAECKELKSKVESVINRHKVEFDNETIMKVVTSLYEDPANIFIQSFVMVELAIQKLSGENIEPALVFARKAAITSTNNK